MNHRESFIFDQYGAITDRRKSFLKPFLTEIADQLKLETALDMGCGIGHFSEFLDEMGMKVIAVDVREENIREAKKRYPHLTFRVENIEDPSVTKLEPADLILCFGLLYHLENPYRAIRNLYSLTKRVLLIESMIFPRSIPGAALVDEVREQDQSLHYTALIPSETGFVKMLYRAGFPAVYKPVTLPNHEDFRTSLSHRRRRTVLLASKTTLKTKSVLKLKEPVGHDIWKRKYGFHAARLVHFLKKPWGMKT
jgi:SAM-dependent methyltransferase